MTTTDFVHLCGIAVPVLNYWNCTQKNISKHMKTVGSTAYFFMLISNINKSNGGGLDVPF